MGVDDVSQLIDRLHQMRPATGRRKGKYVKLTTGETIQDWFLLSLVAGVVVTASVCSILRALSLPIAAVGSSGLVLVVIGVV